MIEEKFKAIDCSLNTMMELKINKGKDTILQVSFENINLSI